MASFGATKLSECRWKPGGFTRLTPEVLHWVKTATGMYHTGIMDQGEMINKPDKTETGSIVPTPVPSSQKTNQNSDLFELINIS